jgi:hypothetical protein
MNVPNTVWSGSHHLRRAVRENIKCLKLHFRCAAKWPRSDVWGIGKRAVKRSGHMTKIVSVDPVPDMFSRFELHMTCSPYIHLMPGF